MTARPHKFFRAVAGAAAFVALCSPVVTGPAPAAFAATTTTTTDCPTTTTTSIGATTTTTAAATTTTTTGATTTTLATTTTTHGPAVAAGNGFGSNGGTGSSGTPGSAASDGQGYLVFTGFNAFAFGLFALALIAAGLLLVRSVRRRRQAGMESLGAIGFAAVVYYTGFPGARTGSVVAAASCGPPPNLPESPFVALIPVSALVLFASVWLLARRRNASA